MKTYKIWFDDKNLYFETDKGILITHELSEFPTLANATKLQRENYIFSPFGIHWPEIDEDLSFEGLKFQSGISKYRQHTNH